MVQKKSPFGNKPLTPIQNSSKKVNSPMHPKKSPFTPKQNNVKQLSTKKNTPGSTQKINKSPEKAMKKEIQEDDSSDDFDEEELKKLLEESDDDDDNIPSEDDDSDAEDDDDDDLEDDSGDEEEDSGEEELSEESDDDEDEDLPPIDVIKQKLGMKRQREDSDDEDSQDEEEKKVNSIISKKMKLDSIKTALKKEKLESDEEDSEDDDEDIDSEEDAEMESEESGEEKVKVNTEKTPVAVGETKVPIVKLDDSKAASKTETADNRPYAIETPKVTDPIIRKKIEDRLKNQAESTLRLTFIPKTCTEATLKKYAPDMLTCRIPWDSIKHISRGHAFVEFVNSSTAEQNLKTLHRCNMDGKRVVASVCNDFISTNVDEYNCHRLALNNLHWKTTKDEIRKLFTKCSTVDFPPIIKSKATDKRMPGIAYVTFNKVSDAIDAFDAHRGKPVRDHQLYISFQKKVLDARKRDSKTLLVFGLSKKVTPAVLRKIFSMATDIKIKPGMAIVSYTDEKECLVDKERGHKATIDDKPLKVFFGNSRHEERISKQREKISTPKSLSKPVSEAKPIPNGPVDKSCLFIKNLHKKTTKKDIVELFPAATHIDVPTKGKDFCKGFAIVKFATPGAAQEACMTNNNRLIHDKKINIAFSVKKVESPSKVTNDSKKTGKQAAAGQKHPKDQKKGKGKFNKKAKGGGIKV